MIVSFRPRFCRISVDLGGPRAYRTQADLPERRCSPMKKSYVWSRLYVNAILETDTRKLPQRIREAEWA
jgi:hypothetical protein